MRLHGWLPVILLSTLMLGGCRKPPPEPYTGPPPGSPMTPEMQAAIDALPAGADSFDQLLAVAGTLKDPAERTQRIEYVVTTLIDEGQIERAVEAARSVEEETARATVMEALVKRLDDKGEEEKAQEVQAELDALRAEIGETAPETEEEEASPQSAPEAETSTDD